MTKDEWLALAPSQALGILYDLDNRISSVAAPQPIRPPKFDSRIPKKGGLFCWASEMTVSDLVWWLRRYQEGAARGGEYAEKDSKNAKAISYWVAYRQAFPFDAWSGERDRMKVQAAAPSRDPAQHPWQRGETKPASTTSGGGFADADYGATDEDDSIPFLTNVTSETHERWWNF